MIEVEIPVRFGDVDAAKIVYYPRYFDYFHRAMEEFVERVLGEPYALWIGERREGFPAVRVETDFHSPLRYGETLRLAVSVDRVGSSSVVWRYVGTEATSERAVVSARITTVFTDLSRLEKRSVPDALRERLLDG